MNVFDKIKQQREHEDKVLDLISQLPEEQREAVGHVGGGVIFMRHNLFNENMVTLTHYRKFHPLELSAYYMNQSQLALKYDASHVSLVMFCTDVEYALTKVGKGKCQIKRRPTDEIETYIECGI